MTEKIQIAQLGADVLRLQAQPVDDFACPEFHSLIASLQDTMLEAGGVGIAAPQIGVSRQILIIASRPTSRYPHAPQMSPILMVNPRFEVLDNDMRKDWEGCLSVPGIRALVPRYLSIDVAYQDRHGECCSLVLQGFPARVFQHEFDHLQGLVYLDRVENNRDIISEAEFFKRIAA
ncbi:peptide deformylase [Methylomonas sp. 2BW1-5-20]|uniref:peptide deformylase n=1 Tax=Methylomonas sp. 2BW1-5-20 TaxID=3376686 RepID=UPI0040520D2E